MKKEASVTIRDHLVHVKYGEEFATMTRKCEKQTITFSTQIKSAFADIIEQSGIAEVESVNIEESTITFSRKCFYETHVMAELILDILMKYETENE